LDFDTVAYFVIIWQIIFNYELINCANQLNYVISYFFNYI